MRNINLRYVIETYDETGFLTDFKLKYPDNFNFGYDIVDDIGTNDPDRPAMLWMNEEGYKRLFTFGDIMKASNKVANFLRKVGIQKGDIVMAVLKRDYRFWFLAPACHKLGAVLLPATHMLKAHDAEYRINASGAKAVVSIDAVTEVFDEVTSICPSLQLKIAAGAKRQGWLDFDEGMEAAEDTLERVETNVKEPMLMYFSSGTPAIPRWCCITIHMLSAISLRQSTGTMPTRRDCT
jgi:acetyl-CoA synthetase